ncbi:MAG TPA: DUF4440 domain-containing protein [Candidatus Eisenbacteria bacterium]|nr:DUF4440 domain-containing protein [Candidatus Eisenbacteria bacterium]
MKKLVVLLAGLAFMVGIAAPALAKKDREKIDERAAAWFKAFEERDSGRVASIYGEDGMLLPPNAEIIQGTEAIATFWKGMMDIEATLQLTNQETQADGKLGYRLGTFKVFAKDGAVLDQGKYVEIWKRHDDQWWMARDIWNSSLPPAVKN